MKLKGRTAAILIDDFHQELDVWYPYLRLIEEGMRVSLVGTGSGTSYLGKHGYPVSVDISASTVRDRRFDLIVIPGGWAPDTLRVVPEVLDIVRGAFDRKSVVLCVGRGGWVLASAGVLQGKRMTAYVAIKDDLVHAGAEYMDSECVCDGNLVTARNAFDLPAAMREVVRLLGRPSAPV